MRRTTVKVLALAAVLVGTGLGWAQQPGPARQEVPWPIKPKAPPKTTLEEMLGQALRNNPDIRVAEARVSEAEAKLHRTRLLVMQKVLAAYHAIESQRAEVEYRQKQFDRMRELHARGTIDANVLEEAQKQLTLAKAKLAAAEADLPYLLGKLPAGAETSAAERSPQYKNLFAPQLVDLPNLPARVRVEVAGPMADKIREALDKRVTLVGTYKDLPEILEKLQEQTGVYFRLDFRLVGLKIHPITADLKGVPLGVALEWLEDGLPGWRFVVRDYGILIAAQEQLPPSAVSLHDFWKRARPAKNPPAENVEGLVNKVDPQSGLVTISIGSDAGLAKGHTLEVYRLKPQPKYLGTLRVMEVTPHQAIAQPVGRMQAKVEAGDRVAGRLLGQ
jgi:hypothetical protein